MSVTVGLLVSLTDKINHNIHFKHRICHTKNYNTCLCLNVCIVYI